MLSAYTILEFCLRKTGKEKWLEYGDFIVCEKLRFQIVFNAKPAFSNSSGLKNVFGKLRFRDGFIVWTVA